MSQTIEDLHVGELADWFSPGESDVESDPAERDLMTALRNWAQA